MIKGFATSSFGSALLLMVLAAMPSAVPAEAQPALPGFQQGAAACRRALPAARRFVGRPEALVRARYRAPAGVAVRYCMMCTRDYRPNRLTFGLDGRNIVRSATCG
ncbi:hypothetical protein [Phreatobacter stygius]|uniref:Peptidase inhibitor I78 n=1 Tax=Phreatobacter stygius TaxID=1940610 RepID=A0A4D7BC01_9HYPH|nr:hypothetical protein [Phreatobacter stygius]QCI65592.1 hypothetical protein E8M01_16080 [Phreatobacter stygius]